MIEQFVSWIIGNLIPILVGKTEALARRTADYHIWA